MFYPSLMFHRQRGQGQCRTGPAKSRDCDQYDLGA